MQGQSTVWEAAEAGSSPALHAFVSDRQRLTSPVTCKVWKKKYSKAQVGLTDSLGLVLRLRTASGLLGWTKVGWPRPSQSHLENVFAWTPSVLSSSFTLVWDVKLQVRLFKSARALQGEPSLGSG